MQKLISAMDVVQVVNVKSVELSAKSVESIDDYQVLKYQTRSNNY